METQNAKYEVVAETTYGKIHTRPGQENLYYSGSINGVRVSKRSLKTTLLRDAKYLAAQIEQEVLRGNSTRRDLTVEQLWQKYIKVQARRVAEKDLLQSSFEEKEMIYRKHLQPFFANVKIKRMNQGSELWAEFKDQVTARKSFTNLQSVFSHFLNWCSGEGYLDRVIPLPIPRPERRSGNALTIEQIKKLYTLAETEEMRLFILIAANCAMRKMEVLTLTWERIDFARKLVRTREEDSRTKKMVWKAMDDDLVLKLKKRKLSSRSSYVFPHPLNPTKHASRDYMWAEWQRIRIAANLKDEFGKTFLPRMHDFRVAWNTTAAESGVDKKLRAEFSGHSETVNDLYTRTRAASLAPLTKVIPVSEITG